MERRHSWHSTEDLSEQPAARRTDRSVHPGLRNLIFTAICFSRTSTSGGEDEDKVRIVEELFKQSEML